MSSNSIKILYVVSASRINKKGLAPLMCRITYLGKRKPFSTGLFINPKYWNSKKQKLIPPANDNEYINSQMSLISQKINKAFLFLQVNEVSFDVEDIYLLYKGENIKKDRTFLEVLELHNKRMEKLVGTEYAPRYYQKWRGTQILLKGFIRYTYKKKDVMLSQLNMKFLDDLDYYLKSEKNQKQITVNKCIQRVRKIARLALSEGYINRDPFLAYKPKRYEKKVVYLTPEELEALRQYKFSQIRLQQVKDMFVFCCYTGLAYAEMHALSKEHVVLGFDGNKWIPMYRQKTKSFVSIPLLPPAQLILEAYRTENAKLLPCISNQKFNSYLKEIADVVGIEKNLTHHMARKTFATSVLLFNDVPIEIVSELLGHSKITVTQQHYAKVVNKKVSQQMQKLMQKLER